MVVCVWATHAAGGRTCSFPSEATVTNHGKQALAGASLGSWLILHTFIEQAAEPVIDDAEASLLKSGANYEPLFFGRLFRLIQPAILAFRGSAAADDCAAGAYNRSQCRRGT